MNYSSCSLRSLRWTTSVESMSESQFLAVLARVWGIDCPLVEAGARQARVTHS
jgi:hypothetical protein